MAAASFLLDMSHPIVSGTEFEKPRGVREIEVRAGFAQVHVTGLGEPLPESRLGVLKAVADAGISLDFLKLTQDGLSFLVPKESAKNAEEALSKTGAEVHLQPDCSIVSVHAVNIRDEEGLVARLVSVAIREGTAIEHLADMHDRLLLVTTDAEAEKLAEVYKREFLRAAP